MTRDQQIGLAMGILLIGAVSAFFFRHEDVSARKLPSLKTAAELDRAIAERQHVPYLPEEEPAVETTAEAPLETADAGLVPDPIAMEGDGPTAVLASSETTVAAPQTESKHIVRSGETLSSIAQQHLGSTARYQDIYEANRDRLRTPNDLLRIGQELRIPGGIARPFKPDKPKTAAAPTETNSPTDNRFVPYRSSPLTPGKAQESSVPPIASPPASANKRLSQLPPKGDTVIR